MAHGWALARDFDRLLDARRRADVSPLGAGASAGTSLPIDPDATAADLGFAARFENSLDAVGDRDFVAESLFALALLGVHLSRLGEEVVWWASEEVGFLRLDDAWATGSSMMPQKKNPDVAELARARAGRLIGNVTGLLATLKGLPLAYNRDLQEDKEPLFDSLAQVRGALAALAGLLRTATFDEARMAAAADDPFLAATDLAEVLVSRGVPFRAAHERIAGAVAGRPGGGGKLRGPGRRRGRPRSAPDPPTRRIAGAPHQPRRRRPCSGRRPARALRRPTRRRHRPPRRPGRAPGVTGRPERSFFERPVTAVAPDLLGMVLACGDRAGRIVEVEAYGGADDPASHGHRGGAARRATR